MKLRRPGREAFVLVFCVIGQPATAEPAIAQQKASKPLVEEGYLTGADDVRLFYRRVGKGSDVIVYLHGGPGASMENDGLLMDPLADKKHTVIMYDQRGAGRSDVLKDASLLTAASHVRDLEALREHFGIERMTLIGLSWGAGLTILYADAHPERVARIVFWTPMPPTKPYSQQRSKKINSLIAPEGLERMKELQKEWATAGDDRIEAVCREYYGILMGPYLFNARSLDPGRLETTIAGREIAGMCGVPPAAVKNQVFAGQATSRSLGDFDFRPMLAKLKVPVLVVEGEKTNVPLEATEEWVKSTPGARLLLIPNAGHMALEEKPEALQEIAKFLNGKWPTTAREMRGSR